MTLLAVPHEINRNFLHEAERDGLLGWALQNQQRFKPATVNDGLIVPNVRASLSLRDLGAFKSILRDRVAPLIPLWIEHLRVTPFDLGEIELELVAHNDGAHFGFHSDMYTGENARRGHRMISAVYYFYREPKAFSGGALRLHRFGAQQDDPGFTDIEPEQNALAVFPSWAPHEVRQVTCVSRDFADSRFSVNCWAYRKL